MQLGLNSGIKNTNTNTNIEQMYEEMQRLKASTLTPSPTNTYRTVFTDISNEWEKCSTEERNFIDNDAAYMQASVNYQQQFNAFLLESFGVQFLNSPYGKSAEEVLFSLKQARSKFKNNNESAVLNIKNENQELKKELEDLKKMLGGRNNE